MSNNPDKIGIRQAVKLAEDHALGILESTNDCAFWGEDFFFDHNEDEEWKIFTQARNIILNRIRRRELATYL